MALRIDFGDNAARRLLRIKLLLAESSRLRRLQPTIRRGRLGVDTLEAVIFWLAIVWTPGLAFLGYLVLQRPPAD